MLEFPVSTEIEVRFRDTDAMGHVNNAVFVTYLEIGRQAYWKRLGDQDDYAQVPFVVANVSMDFRSQLRVNEKVRVQLKTTWIGRSSFGMKYLLTECDSGRVVAEAESTQVTFDYDSQRSMPVPQWLREKLERLEGRPLPARQSEG